MKRLRTIQSKLFIHYSIVVLIIIVLFFSIFYYYVANILKNNIDDSMSQLADDITQEIDAIFEKANSLSVNLLYSDSLIDLTYQNMYGSDTESILLQNKFYSQFYSITGPDLYGFQINFFRMTGEYIGIGNTVVLTNKAAENIQVTPWLSECYQNNGAKTIIGTHDYTLNKTNTPVLSLSRSFSQYWGKKKDSILEIQIKYDAITQIINHKLNLLNNKPQIYIYDNKGNLVYPFEQKNETVYQYYEAFNHMSATSIVADINDQKYTLVKSESQYTGFSAYIVQDHSSLFHSVNQFRNIIILLGLISIFVTLIITYQISRSITVPIRKINESVEQLTINTLPNGTKLSMDVKVNELEHLKNTFQNMCIRLQKSIDDTVKIRSMEAHSRMLALQSQMNPHFLYNTLTTISILAEKSEYTQIVKICDALTDMMRYITSDAAECVSLAEELRHVQFYIDLMHIRFEEDLKFKVHIPSNLMQIKIPKLIIQPLIENSIKYTTKIAPPWLIKIDGWIEDHFWFIKVSDTGHGFSDLKIEEIKRKIAGSMENEHTHIELKGMGLINIYIRLKLTYRNIIFEFGNNDDGGAFVLLGAPLSQKNSNILDDRGTYEK